MKVFMLSRIDLVQRAALEFVSIIVQEVTRALCLYSHIPMFLQPETRLHRLEFVCLQTCDFPDVLRSLTVMYGLQRVHGISRALTGSYQ